MKPFRIFGRNIRDAFKSVFRNFSLSLASIACIVITLMVVSIAMILSYNVNNFTEMVEKDLTIVVFLDRHTTLERIEELKEEINLINDVESIAFQDKMDIAKEMMESSDEYKVVLEEYQTRETNPLSDTLHIKVTEVEKLEEVATQIEELKDVISVKYGKGMVEQLVSVFDMIKNVSYGVVIALILVTAFLISNTIKIAIASRKREIEIMRLVGASNINIKIPFIFEGLFLGIFGSIIPIVATILSYDALYKHFNGQIGSPFIQLITPLPFTYFISIILLIIGVLVGMFGSLGAVKKHLKI